MEQNMKFVYYFACHIINLIDVYKKEYAKFGKSVWSSKMTVLPLRPKKPFSCNCPKTVGRSIRVELFERKQSGRNGFPCPPLPFQRIPCLYNFKNRLPKSVSEMIQTGTHSFNILTRRTSLWGILNATIPAMCDWTAKTHVLPFHINTEKNRERERERL